MIKCGIIVVLIIASFFGGYFVNRYWDSAGNSQLTQQLQVIQTEKAKIDEERNVLKEQIKIKDEQAAVKELEVGQLKDLISANGKGINDEKQKVEQAVKEYEEDITNTNLPSSDYDRCVRIQSRSAELGYKFAANFCDKYRTR